MRIYRTNLLYVSASSGVSRDTSRLLVLPGIVESLLDIVQARSLTDNRQRYCIAL